MKAKPLFWQRVGTVVNRIGVGMEGLRPLLFGGLQEKWSTEIMRHREGVGGASQLVYIHVT